MRKYILTAFAISAALCLTACGGSDSDESYSASEYGTEAAYTDDAYYSDDVYEYSEPAETRDASGSANTSSDEQLEAESTGRKLIKTINMSVQTKEFDTLIENVKQKISALGGYPETLEVNGYEYNASETSVRNAYIVARIPADKLDSFVSSVEAESNITSKNESTSDVTLEYSDVEAHRDSLRIEQERLNELLEEADSLETIIALEERLTEVRYELESYESRLKTMDNQVDYSTVYLNIQEVKDYTPIVTAQKSFGKRLAEGFLEGCGGAVEGLGDFIIGFFSILPGLVVFLLILAIIGLIIFGIVKLIIKIVKKSGRKKSRGGQAAPMAKAPAVKQEKPKPVSNSLETSDNRGDNGSAE